jgi:hypothetical protein
LKQYQLIPSPPLLSADHLRQYEWPQQNENDRVDNLLLHALCRGAVHLLVTNDRGIHQKARSAQVQEQVHYLSQFLGFLEKQCGKQKPPPFGLEDCHLHEFDVKQPFFDSLRDAYDGFDAWYMRCAQEHRKAWCITDEKKQPLAICIYKEEESPTIVANGNPLNGRALKLCTFKVGENVRGRKLGERLLFSAFKFAVNKDIPYVYLHTYGKEQGMLVSLCQDYGFEEAGKNEKDEDVYLKKMSRPTSTPEGMSALTYAINYYPHYLDSDSVGKFIVPIQPKFHDDLFPDTSDTAQGLFANDHRVYNPQANAIKKAYICHSNTKQIKIGDLLLFFRTRDRKSIECMGIVEQTYYGRDVNKVLPLVSKRTVFSQDKIQEKLQKDALVILFRFLRNFDPISGQTLLGAGIKGPIQSIRKISHEQYAKCFSGSSNE